MYSDQPFHIGGDGMLGGVWRPNPGTCQLTRSFTVEGIYRKKPTLFFCRLPVLRKNPLPYIGVLIGNTATLLQGLLKMKFSSGKLQF
jgi:hypothetical protein